MNVPTWLILIGLAVLIIGAFLILAYLCKAKCPQCKKRNCIETGRKETSRQQVMFWEEETITHVDNKNGLYGETAKAHAQVTAQWGKPDSISVRRYKVPGERIHYLVTYQCNNCGCVFTGNIYVDKKPPTV